MRSFYFTTASLFAAWIPFALSADELLSQPRVLEYNIESAYTKFTLPCPASAHCSSADEALVFDLQLRTTTEHDVLAFDLNGWEFEFTVVDQDPEEYSGILAVDSTTAKGYALKYTATPFVRVLSSEDLTQGVHFRASEHTSANVSDLGFAIEAHSFGSPRLLGLYLRTVSSSDPQSYDGVYSFANVSRSFGVTEPAQQDDTMPSTEKHVSFDLSNAFESLHLLEDEAEILRDQIIAKKQAIAQHLKEHRDQVSLRHLLKECDGLVCAARVLAQRICDKVGVLTEPSIGYASFHKSHFQHAIAFHDSNSSLPQNTRNCTKSKTTAQYQPLSDDHTNGTAQSLNTPLMMTKGGSTHDFHFDHLVGSANPLVRALTLIATIIGLVALCRFIHRRCMSMRKRVERAADREERRNARAYRKAARRAEMRKRWDAFVRAVNCFRSASEPRMEDYEEKRALILEAAFLEQLEDADQAEKGEIMEAEIRELRHAHEIVASLVRVDEHRYDLVAPVNDPPPPLVPLPYTPATRSRASTGTLPSYTSESLPDYSSRPETLIDSTTSDSLVDGFAGYTPTQLTGESRHTTSPPSTTSSGRTRYTPGSSVIEVSPRPSQETLRTRQSKDAHD